MKHFIMKNKLYFISFFIPSFIMILIFIGREIYPFGDESFLHIDMYHQYFPFLVELHRKLTGGGSLFYSWNTGIGSNFLALFVYYLATPLYWFVIFCKESSLMEFISYLVILKIGLCGGTFSYYLSKHFHTDSLFISFFATFYALSGYMAAYNWNVMWLDSIVLTPLIILGLEKLVEERKSWLYCITLTISIFSNYYISALICEFLILYFVVLLISKKREHKSDYGKAFLRFSLYSLLAGGMSAILVIPELCALRFTEFSNVSFPQKVSTYFSVIDMLARHCFNVTVETGLDHWPNIYCGVAVFFLLPLYIMQKKIPLREKVPKLCLLFFLLISFSTNVLNFIWHGLNYPDSLPARQSFLYIFLLLSLCFEAFLYMKEYSRTEMLRLFGGVVFYLLLCEKLITDDAFSSASVLISGIFLLAYGILLHMYRSRETITKGILFASLFIIILEATGNTILTSVPTVSRSKYYAHFEDYKTLLERNKTEQPDFYRVEKFKRTTQNDAMLIGFPSATLFSSTSNALVKDFYSKYGMKSSRVYYCFDGATPLMDALLTVKYKFSTSPDEDSYAYQLIDEENGIYLYENKYAMPVGYMIDENMVTDSDPYRLKREHTPKDEKALASQDREEPMMPDTVEYAFSSLFNNADDAADLLTDDTTISKNPFINQNAFVSNLNLSDPLFEASEIDEAKDHATITVLQSGYQYAYTSNKKIDTISMNCGSKSKKFTAIKRKYILDLGYFEAGDEIHLSSDNGEELQLCAYTFQDHVFQQLLNSLNRQTLEVTESDDTHFHGKINVTSKGQLVLSIPYEPGWKIFVDGKESNIQLFEDVFMSVSLTEGEHEISLSYVPQGFYPGVIISVLSLCITIGIFLFMKHTAKKYRDS